MQQGLVECSREINRDTRLWTGQELLKSTSQGERVSLEEGLTHHRAQTQLTPITALTDEAQKCKAIMFFWARVSKVGLRI